MVLWVLSTMMEQQDYLPDFLLEKRIPVRLRLKSLAVRLVSMATKMV